MRNIDWEILSELYKNPNITKVSNLFYMSQPALTKRLKQIEDYFQVTIVNRTPKGLSFTPEGKYLAEQAEKHIAFMNETHNGLLALHKNASTIITIGSSYTYSKYMLYDVLFRYNLEYPRIQFQVITDQSRNLYPKMLEESIDVAFVRGNYDGPFNKVLVGRSNGYIVSKGSISLQDLPFLQRIEYETNDFTLKLLNNWWSEHFDGQMPAGMTVAYVDIAWQLIEKGFGYTCCFLPEIQPEIFEKQFGLTLTPLTLKDGSPVMRDTWFLYPKTKRISDSLQTFIDFIVKELGEKIP